ncbi:hypothetical protein Mgra_00003946, partial [Meloidogyne graminicola]
SQTVLTFNILYMLKIKITQNYFKRQHFRTCLFQSFQSFIILIFFINFTIGNISFSNEENNLNELERLNNDELNKNTIIFVLSNHISDQLLSGQRIRRNTERRLVSLSAENGNSFPWKKRYYVTRWHRRRFVPVNSKEDGGSLITSVEFSTEPRRLCGIKLTNRTRELCGDCGPANMQRVELMDKKADKTVASRERLTQMCCEKRCTDADIRSYCCRS